MSANNPPLKVADLTKSFGGLTAVSDLSFTLGEGGIHSIIGPNGSGKTTLLNLISGVYTPNSGVITMYGSNVTRYRCDQLAARGLGRTFQNLQVCAKLSALENILVGAHLRSHFGLIQGLLSGARMRSRSRELSEEARALLDLTGLSEYEHSMAAAMPYGALKKLEIARALAAKPKLLLLDEPAAGLNPTEKIELGRLLEKISTDGITIVLVEHDMRMVMELSDHILVLDRGKLLAEGDSDAIKHNPDVVAAYLGQEPEVHA